MSNESKGRPPTIYDVAALAGVSHQTVSRFVKGHTNIRPEIRDRVESAVKALDYKPNGAARALATSRGNRIGALVYELMEVGPNKIIHGASIRAREAGYLLDIVSLDPNDDAAIVQAIGLINQHDLAGVMVFAPTDRVIDAVGRVRFTVPVHVESDMPPQGSATPAANEVGAGMLMDHLAALGHRRFFQIAGPPDWPSARARAAAYDSALENLADTTTSAGTVHGDWTAASGYRAAMEMPLDAGVTALVVGNDQMALGALAALGERGVRVPNEVSVVGFDGIPESEFYRPSLTTIRLDLEGLGASAIDRLLSMGVEAAAPTPAVPAPPRLIVGHSTAAPGA
ncbi:LacI family DNA-binding transcriptional regulator [Sinomonas susongensis]|uniref:LacI family DNA-binding transcriptional regulator n=1 Tax=Sinomonas susongensis TaxID=1324851 RepID=UPI001108AA50|nr:LacI family DNA-binding transcriptional regulator [Sinomonas susongensis]